MRPMYEAENTAPLGRVRSKVKFQTYSVGACKPASREDSMRSPNSVSPFKEVASRGNCRLPGTLPPAVPISERTSWPNPVNRGPSGLPLSRELSNVFAWLVKFDVNPRELFRSQSTASD